MTDIVARLKQERQLAINGNHPILARSFGLAIDEIERLLELVHYCNGTCDLAIKQRDAAEVEVKRLRAENARLRASINSGPIEVR